MSDPDDAGHYEPNRLEIRTRAVAIRQTWDPKERERRWMGAKRERWQVPMVAQNALRREEIGFTTPKTFIERGY